MVEQGASLAFMYIYVLKVNVALYLLLKSLGKINSEQET
jgi:hypothetical protein